MEPSMQARLPRPNSSLNDVVTTVKARCEAIKAGDKSAMEMTDQGFTV